MIIIGSQTFKRISQRNEEQSYLTLFTGCCGYLPPSLLLIQFKSLGWASCAMDAQHMWCERWSTISVTISNSCNWIRGIFCGLLYAIARTHGTRLMPLNTFGSAFAKWSSEARKREKERERDRGGGWKVSRRIANCQKGKKDLPNQRDYVNLEPINYNVMRLCFASTIFGTEPVAIVWFSFSSSIPSLHYLK